MNDLVLTNQIVELPTRGTLGLCDVTFSQNVQTQYRKTGVVEGAELGNAGC